MSISMKMREFREGKAVIKAPDAQKISREMDVFYNPVMKNNRDFSILLLRASGRKLRIADIMAGTGVRSIRFLLETDNVESIYINDYDESSVNIIRENLKLNKIDNKKVFVSQEEANKFLLSSKGFDYIDIDPFGTPNPFLDSAVKRILADGIIAVTATDTSALSGTYENACKRKYFARPLRNEMMHETGLRILIRKIQLVGLQYEKALLPVFSFSKDHYFRVFLICKKSKMMCTDIIKKHNYLLYCRNCLDRKISDYNNEKCSCGNTYDYAGPLWTGDLWDTQLAEKMLRLNTFPDIDRMLRVIVEESRINSIGFYDLHKVLPKYKIRLMKTSDIIMKTKSARTHFSDTAVRSNLAIRDFIEKIKSQ